MIFPITEANSVGFNIPWHCESNRKAYTEYRFIRFVLVTLEFRLSDLKHNTYQPSLSSYSPLASSVYLRTIGSSRTARLSPLKEVTERGEINGNQTPGVPPPGVRKLFNAAVGSNDLMSLKTRRSDAVAAVITSCPAVSVGNLGLCRDESVSNSICFSFVKGIKRI